ncbi:hypothetical protein SAMN04489735_100242 [Aneurinibacillus thermoaerophilus]|uniref:Uncharacterized protein n=1 Tax=Aneurinibacillus thermoaerophilus TaxID=143495 RepID=A0A1G7WP73_ANETH|nr:hypothetical protein [Aneurinibacillus thermoaerophilus]SDG73761.1 hypothetical protein SAMN04489735_100242 [Aneurinibacillus thermoaerophilus]
MTYGILTDKRQKKIVTVYFIVYTLLTALAFYPLYVMHVNANSSFWIYLFSFMLIATAGAIIFKRMYYGTYYILTTGTEKDGISVGWIIAIFHVQLFISLVSCYVLYNVFHSLSLAVVYSIFFFVGGFNWNLCHGQMYAIDTELWEKGYLPKIVVKKYKKKQGIDN